MFKFFKPTSWLALLILFVLGQAAYASPLFVGANYHPHDSEPETWERDIALMKVAGIRVVRMGHLAWDSYEPEEGRFEFAWFDRVMDLMQAAGIRVILDLPVRPAPVWLQKHYPTASVTDINGLVQYPNHRYMEDVGDPEYRRLALRFAETLARRYARHPALVAFGIDNEPGDGRVSYSASCRDRFIKWLAKKYGTLEVLNEKWSSQRWSRKLRAWDDIGLPVTNVGADGPPERVLDFRTFVSEEVREFFVLMQQTVDRVAPEVLTTTNMWYYSPRKYFDYAPIAYAGKLTRCGFGFYPGGAVSDSLDDALFGISRIQFENTTPFWCTEFISASAAPGVMRRAAYASLMFGNQLACVWTWQSMHAGEEQFLQGLIDWDGKPNRKYHEYALIASEFRKLEAYPFPYVPQAEIAVALSFGSQLASQAFPESHEQQALGVFSRIIRRNIDARVVDLRFSQLPYKVLFLPGTAMLAKAEAETIRRFVEAGGCVVMTSQSAVMDENGRVLSSTRPGYLADVFGVRVGGFEETKVLNEAAGNGAGNDEVHISLGSKKLSLRSPRFDVVELQGANLMGSLVNLPGTPPVITTHRFGKGLAIYCGIPARAELVDALLDDLTQTLSLREGPPAPMGVMARRIDDRHILYLNLEATAKTINIPQPSRSVLYNRDYADEFILEPLAPDFIELSQPDEV